MIVNGKTRRACSLGCGFVFYDNPTPVVAAIVEYRGQVLLAHNKTWPPTWYGPIAGFLERNEEPHAAIVREVKEELNLEAATPTLIGVYSFHRMNQIIIAYHVVADGKVKLSNELTDWRCYSFDKIRYWPAGTGYALRDWLRARGYEPLTLP